VVTVDLARNFGHRKAMMTGLALATDDRVLLVDSDLEQDAFLGAPDQGRLRCGVRRSGATRRFDRTCNRRPVFSLVDLLSAVVAA
jgi:glycosyltransferase involved in cell wall biosynthesis